MIGLDTNVLVRYLVQDDPDQAERATRSVERFADTGETALLDGVVLCETVWVLMSGYGHARAPVADVLERLLLTRQFEIADRDHVWRALARFKQGRGDFADYLIGEKNLFAGCDRTVTFDGALEAEEGFELL